MSSAGASQRMSAPGRRRRRRRAGRRAGPRLHGLQRPRQQHAFRPLCIVAQRRLAAVLARAGGRPQRAQVGIRAAVGAALHALQGVGRFWDVGRRARGAGRPAVGTPAAAAAAAHGWPSPHRAQAEGPLARRLQQPGRAVVPRQHDAAQVARRLHAEVAGAGGRLGRTAHHLQESIMDGSREAGGHAATASATATTRDS